MLLSAIDPTLLIYNYEDWQTRKSHCFSRFTALTLHRGMFKQYGQKMAMSSTFASLIYQHFPWNDCSVSELRDLRRFILEDLTRAYYLSTDAEAASEAELQPTGVVCMYIEAPEVIDAWKELLCGCVDDAISAEFDSQIATWDTPSLREHCGPMTLTIHDSEQVYHLPLVWDDDSWAAQFVPLGSWPDLHHCVELHFKTTPSMRSYPGVRQQPIPFKWTDAFLKSVEQRCKNEHLRRSLIKALTKRVYGILDAALGDEPLGSIRRFRVTDFWRVHYREESGQLVLEEFGPHDIGGVG